MMILESYHSCRINNFCSLYEILWLSCAVLCSLSLLIDILLFSFKTLDAPEILDDFYLNLLSWSSKNILAVGLGSCVYLWNQCTGQVTELTDLMVNDSFVTSVAWNKRVSTCLTHYFYSDQWNIYFLKFKFGCWLFCC
jgi:WD40 repeat protein